MMNTCSPNEASSHELFKKTKKEQFSLAACLLWSSAKWGVSETPAAYCWLALFSNHSQFVMSSILTMCTAFITIPILAEFYQTSFTITTSLFFNNFPVDLKNTLISFFYFLFSFPHLFGFRSTANQLSFPTSLVASSLYIYFWEVR